MKFIVCIFFTTENNIVNLKKLKYFFTILPGVQKQPTQSKAIKMSTTSCSSWASVVMKGSEKAVEKNMQIQYNQLCIIAENNEAKAKLEKIKKDNEYLQLKARRERRELENERKDEMEEQYLRLKLGPNWYACEESLKKLPGRCWEVIEEEREREEKIERWERADQKRFDDDQARLKASMPPEEWLKFNAQQHDDWMDEGSCQFGMQMERTTAINREREKQYDNFLQLHPGFK